MQRLCIVTGANRGIGFEVCRQLARLDYRVLLTSRDAAKGGASAQRLAEEGLSVLFHQLDVTDEASTAALRKFVVKEFGRLDVLVNAGTIYDGKSRIWQSGGARNDGNRSE